MIARLLALAVVCAATLAHADKAKAEEHYKRGSALYNLGKFDEAIAAFTAAYSEEPTDHSYLYNIAQTYRLAANYERAIYTYRRYLSLVPDASNRSEIEGYLRELERAQAEKVAADKIRDEQALAAKIALEKAAKDKADAEIAARKARESAVNKRLRISIEAGLSIVHLRGVEADPRAPSLGGRVAVSWIRRVGGYTFDLGGLWQITTIPYDEDLGMMRVKQTAVFMTQLHGTASVLHDLVGPVWGRASIGLGLSGFGNLKDGNPVTDDGDDMTMDGGPDVRALCARLDTAVGYRYTPTIDFVLGVASGSISAKTKDAPNLGRVLTFEGFYLGLYIKL